MSDLDLLVVEPDGPVPLRRALRVAMRIAEERFGPHAKCPRPKAVRDQPTACLMCALAIAANGHWDSYHAALGAVQKQLPRPGGPNAPAWLVPLVQNVGRDAALSALRAAFIESDTSLPG